MNWAINFLTRYAQIFMSLIYVQPFAKIVILTVIGIKLANKNSSHLAAPDTLEKFVILKASVSVFEIDLCHIKVVVVIYKAV